MAYIKRFKYNELIGGTDNTDVYPVTSTEAVYGPDNISQQTINEDRLRRIELLEKNVQSLDGLKEMVDAFISGDYDYQGGLSDNNFTDELKEKLEGLSNYDDTQLRQLLADINTAKANAKDVYTKSEIDDKLGDIQGALTFDNTPIAGSDNPVKSSGIYTALQGKQDTISDLNDIRTHASEFSNSPAASITSTNINSWNQAAEGGGTITGITMNGSSKGTSGVVDLGTVVTQEADPTVPSWAKASTKPSYTAQEVGALPDTTVIPTESTVTGWGFTKNAGTITGITMNGASKGTSGVVNLGTVITEHQDISGKANSADVYTKAQVDDMIDDVAYLGDDNGQATTLDFDPQADTVWNKAQTLGSAQQAQARNNIGAVGSVTVNGTTYTPTNGNVDLGTISGVGGSVTVDSALSTTSTNPVQNSVITTALNGKVGSSTITSIVSLTEAAYTALATKDASTLYVIIES